jgi:hypothetical protein
MTDTTTQSDYPTGWKPDPGASITGQVIDIATGDGGYGVYPIVTLRTEQGDEIAIHAFHTVLRTELARRRPKIGDTVGITYHGKRANASGKGEYHSYRVTGGQTQGYDWSRDLPPEEQPVEPDIPIDMVTPAAPTVPQPATVAAASVTTTKDDSIPF